jgi:hypothetical protein
MAALSRTSASTDRLRRDVDSGRTGDKVNWPDPAAAPLGTDDEAAGTPPSAGAVGAAHAYETSRPHGDPHARTSGVGFALWVGVFVVIAGAIVGLAMMGL